MFDQREIGDCPYDGICLCRAQNLRRRTSKCVELAKKFVDGVPVKRKRRR